MRWHKNWKENAFAGAEITAREMIWHCKTWGTEGDRAVKGVRSYRQKVWTKAAWWHKYYFTFNKDHLTRLLALEVDQCVASKEDWGQQDSFIAFYSFIFQKKYFLKRYPVRSRLLLLSTCPVTWELLTPRTDQLLLPWEYRFSITHFSLDIIQISEEESPGVIRKGLYKEIQPHSKNEGS